MCYDTPGFGFQGWRLTGLDWTGLDTLCIVNVYRRQTLGLNDVARQGPLERSEVAFYDSSSTGDEC